MPEPSLPTVAYADFARLDIRVGTIVAAEPLPRARVPAYKLVVDFGAPLGLRASSSQLVANYGAEALLGRQVVAVVNFEPKRVAGFTSEVLVLGANDAAGNVVIAALERAVPDGTRLY
ncbi:MAG: tRNA-binding protein [Vulcanimicrobiaceae bacterium]